MELTTRKLDVKIQKLNEQLLLLGGTIRQAEARLTGLETQLGRIEGGVLMLQDLRNDVVAMDEAVAKKEAEDAVKALKDAEDRADLEEMGVRVDERAGEDSVPFEPKESVDPKKPLPVDPARNSADKE